MNKIFLLSFMFFSALKLEAISVGEVFSFFKNDSPIHITQKQAVDSITVYSTKVVSSAAKVVIGVTAATQEDLKTADSTEGLKDWNGNPLPTKPCVRFMNAQESEQAVDVDGTGVVIVNNVKPEDALKVFEEVKRITGSTDLNKSIEDGLFKLSPKAVKLLIHFINKVGYADVYNSDVTFIEKNMTSVFPDDEKYMHGNAKTPLGFFKRDSRDVCYAFFVPGKVDFEGPAATVQQAENGAYIVLHGKELRLVQKSIFEETYVCADGAKIIASKCAKFVPTSTASAA